MQETNTAPQLVAAPKPRVSLVEKFAARFSVEPGKMLNTLKKTAFRQRPKRGEATLEITDEQMMALLVVADQYGLNPWTKEIFAFEDKGAIIPVVSVDGWARIINEHPAYDNVEFRYSDETVNPDSGKPCPAWCEAVIYRKDRNRPQVVREYLDEVYVPPRNGYFGPWQTHTKRMLRHKTLIQCARLAFGFVGIYDEDEAYRIIEGESRRVAAPVKQGPALLELGQRLSASIDTPDPVPVEIIDTATGEVLVERPAPIEQETAAAQDGEPEDLSNPNNWLPKE